MVADLSIEPLWCRHQRRHLDASAIHWLFGAFMHTLKTTLIAAACLAFASVAAQATIIKSAGPAAAVEASPGMRLVPSGKGFAVQEAGPSNTANPGKNGINYHGGSVMLGGVNVYYIWYGDAWAGNTGTTILADLMNSTGGSPHYNINTTYYQGVISGKKVTKKKPVSSVVTLAGQTSVTSASGARWHGTTLSQGLIKTIVSEAISAGDVPSDTGGLYFVLTDSVTKLSGFCTSYCGWHANGAIGGQNIKYSFVGNPATQCPRSCSVQTTSPNDNAGADGMASVIMHELEEAATDPDVSGGGLSYGWYDDATGMENGDKCAWTFGTTYITGNGSKANMKLGARDYLIQQNWVNDAGGYCAVSY
jgi:hypothetical protein